VYALFLQTGNELFLLGLGALCLISWRHLPRSDDSARNCEFVALVIVGMLCVTGFALAHTGMNSSWVGRPAVTNWHWLRLAAPFILAVAASHCLLRATKSRLSQIVLPVASALALLGLLTVYVWEVRDANAYISTAGLPAMREYAAHAEQVASSADDADAVAAFRESLPDEVSYELDADNVASGRYATALNAEWVRSYNEAVRRFESTVVLGAPQPDVSPVDPYSATHRQLIAVSLAILLVPMWGWLFKPERLVRALASQSFVIASGLILITTALVGVLLAGGAVPSLPLLTAEGVNTFEVFKVILIFHLASALSLLRSEQGRSWGIRCFIGFSLVTPLAAFASRDLGTTLVLALLAMSLLIMAARGNWRLALFATCIGGAVALPALLYLSPDSVSTAAQARLEAWIDPEAAFEESSEQNIVGASLQRIIDNRVQTEPSSSGLSEVVRDDISSVLHELDWRLQVLQIGLPGDGGPFVPETPAEDLLLVEADTLWHAIGGYGPEASSEEGMSTVAQGLSDVRERFDTTLAGLVESEARPDPREFASIDTSTAFAEDAGPGIGAASNLSRAVPLTSDNFQLHRASTALEAGGVFGVGLGQGRPEMIPGLTEDAAFAALGESLGLIGSVLILALLACLVYRAFSAAVAVGAITTGLVVSGCALLLGAQALVSLGGLLGILPYTGVGFPLISRSGSGVIMNFLLVAVIGNSVVRVPAPELQSPPLTGALSRKEFVATLGRAGIAGCFGFVLFGLASLQIGRRSISPGRFLRSETDPEGASANIDQWSHPLYYRTLPGAILDREGGVLAETHLDGAGWRSPDPEMDESLGHIVQALDGLSRTKARAPGTGSDA
jgi:cell division protein FtsW (lipid II flippase)